MKHLFQTAGLIGVALLAIVPAAHGAGKPTDRIVREARHELLTLSNYGVFDDIRYEVKGDNIILTGVVTRPTLKSDAERSVKSIEGVAKVENRIEVLPLSPGDDRIRIATYRAIYAHPALDRYGLNATLPIHIIVKDGDITLTGVVSSELDRTIAGTQANGVSGVHTVKNELRIEK